MRSKMGIRKRIIAFMLCMVLVIGNSLSIMADGPAMEKATVEKQVIDSSSEEQAAEKEEDKKSEASTEKKEEEKTESTTEKKDEAKAESTTEKKDEAKAESTTEKKDEAKAESTTEKQDEDKSESTTEKKEEASSEEKADEAKAEHPKSLVWENDQMIITVAAEAEDAIPVGASLKVTPLVKNSDATGKQYEEVEKQLETELKKEENLLAGFLAYDIIFLDKDGKEVEPDGKVKVTMDYKEAVGLDMEKADDVDVTMYHLEEDADGKVKQVVDMSENGQMKKLDTTKKQDVRLTEFHTDSFSVFTITWTYGQRNDWKTLEINAHYGYMDGESFKEFPGGTVGTGPMLNLANDKDFYNYQSKGNIPKGSIFKDLKLNSATGTSFRYLKIEKDNNNYNLKYSEGGNRKNYKNINEQGGVPQSLDIYYIFDYLTITAHYGYVDDDQFVEFKSEAFDEIQINKTDQDKDYYDYLDKGNVPKGYIFQDLKLNSVTGTSFQYLKIENNNLKYSEGGDRKNYKNVNEQGGVPRSLEIYYIFEPEYAGGEGGQGGDVTVEQQLSKTKTATLNDDGSYELALTIAGNIGTITNKAKVDVVMVLDASGSMKGTKLDQTQAAAKNLIDTLETNDTVDARYNIVSFATNASAVGWRNGNNAKSDIDALDADGGTNYEAGLTMAKEELKRARQGAMTIVIFLTDGQPTYYGIDEVKGRGNSTSVATLNAAMTAASNLTASKFYILGLDLTGDVKIYEKDSGDRVEETISIGTLFQRILNASKITDKASFLVGSTNLAEEFKKIAGDITTMQCSNVTITDKLSEYAQVILDAQGKARNLRVETYKDDTKVDTPSGITPSYDKDTKTITLNFPDEYNLEKGYTYKVLVDIEPTDAAYEAYRKDGYPHTGEEGTGTHANQAGFYSNDNENAVVTYDYNGENKTEKYPKPVIQLKTGDLKLKKTITGLTADEIKALKDFKFTVTLNGKKESIPFNNFTKQTDGSYTYTLQRLKAGTAYTVTESGYELDGYDVEAQYLQDGTPVNVTPENGCKGTIKKGEEATAEFTNTYKSNLGSITIKKQDMGGKSLKGAQFKLEKKVSGDSWEVVGAIQTTPENGTIVFDELSQADYRITEVQSPEGYSLLANPIEVTLPYKVAKNSEDANVSGDPDRGDDNFNYYYNVTYTIQNNQLFTMPEAGSNGAPFNIYVLGAAMLLAAAGGTVIMRRRSKARV